MHFVVVFNLRRFARDKYAKVIGVVRDTGTRGLSPDDVRARQPSQFHRSYTQAGLVPATVICPDVG